MDLTWASQHPLARELTPVYGASSKVDDTGKSYYGGANLYFLRADGEEAGKHALVAGLGR